MWYGWGVLKSIRGCSTPPKLFKQYKGVGTPENCILLLFNQLGGVEHPLIGFSVLEIVG